MSTTTSNLHLIQPERAESGIMTTYKNNNTTIDNAYGQYVNDYEQSLENVAPIEGTTASKNYTVGSYLVKDGGLYKVTAAIASGESIVVGTNVIATNLNDAVVELNTAVAAVQDSLSGCRKVYWHPNQQVAPNPDGTFSFTLSALAGKMPAGTAVIFVGCIANDTTIGAYCTAFDNGTGYIVGQATTGAPFRYDLLVLAPIQATLQYSLSQIGVAWSSSVVTNTVPNTTSTIIRRGTLSAGTWVIISYVEWSSSINSVYNHVLNVTNSSSETVRSNMLGGGGSINATIAKLRAPVTVELSVWQSTGETLSTSAGSAIRAVCIGPVVD